MKENENDIVILSAARTPFGRLGGSLKNIGCYELGAIPMKEVMARIGMDPALIDEVYWGVGDTSSCKDVYTPIAGRQSALMAGIPCTTPTLTLDKACVSGTSAIAMGIRALQLGEARFVMAGGATTFSQEPFILRADRFKGHKMGDMKLEDPLVGLGYKDYNPVAVDAGERAVINEISREEQDAWAVRSHRLYTAAWEAGKFKEEMIPFQIGENEGEPVYLEKDEQHRPDTTIEKLAKLKTIYGNPTVTAGNAPGMNDGAAAIILSTRKNAEAHGFKPLARILSYACAADEPAQIPEIPAKAIRICLDRAGLTTDDVDMIEINEAFAVMPLASTKILAGGDMEKAEQLRAKTNINGGAIAIGHANTATGARLVMTMMYELIRRGGGRGVCGICGGLGQGDAILIEV